ncbi:hypothetical protein ABB37_06713 [Leptomonas pyrrhocoris]|uniref:Stealth protein CR3 conserved region 3 domain-containing protein n=1 Tax=Leptomonas pyrrhocoris TaxID=157538 RepID=A0A0M9FXG6_LEPPY|nr:hypothetical protein ABB37_06706 [Leptomonas pyrrhocoris]XP_015656376.1 hypothetical protein ABB37_06713 [Leptomonas pyrrhocoris]KPA77928.1 hypothetical protein ABB37_06706 [Leptomonas pyrrhocoris]KPA77937.1 hypothetical protein ABB37_06713 [Leptomonas pyrrhocoris]|eukprot:XP_015656367.1 hypothetical protein ABB37_06706 [Leptomonas pyrrhocoris]
MKRTSRLLCSSFYALCVMRLGGRLGRLCGSEKAGRGCAVFLVLVCVTACLAFALVEITYLSRFLHRSPGGTAPSGVRAPRMDQWGRDVSTDRHFAIESLAYANLPAAQQAHQRSQHAAIEERRRKVMEMNGRRIVPRVAPGARDPNAFRLDPVLAASLPRHVEAIVDGIALLRPPGTPPLPSMHTYWRTYTADELYARYDDLDYLYSFVNGTEANHNYRKKIRVSCGRAILALEETYFREHSPLRKAQGAVLTGEGAAQEAMAAAEGRGTGTKGSADAGADVLRTLDHECSYYHSMTNLTNDVFLNRFSGSATAQTVDDRDRETDELRHSIRSLEQHVQWHRGRVVIVSPGHHPTWVDGARNFLAGVCGGASVQALRSRGTHLRLTTVHQDALMPYGMRLTADSHVIEQHIWRVRNTTAVHVYMNDDYFVNRDVAITDLFNEYGGTIVRTESGVVSYGKTADEGISWAEGVANTELFLIQHLERSQEDALPPSLARHWKKVLRLEEKASARHKLFARVKEKEEGATSVRATSGEETAMEEEIQRVLSFRELLLTANSSFYWEAALESPVTVSPMPEGSHIGALQRFYATHAPFVYCTNMFRHFSVRFEGDMAPLQLRHRERKARDLFVPFLYNGFIMARPWEASAKFLPYLLELSDASAMAAADTKTDLGRMPDVTAPYFQEKLHAAYQRNLAKYVHNVSIYLDNDDGCAPPTLYRSPSADVVYMRAQDDLEQNQRAMNGVTSKVPLYFNINAGFTSAEAAKQVKEFLHRQYPTPLYLEKVEEKDMAHGLVLDTLTKVFTDLMQLPIVGVVSYEEGVCPLVRSLSLAFAGHHRGRVHVAVQRYGDGEADETLREARTRLRNRVISAVPVTGCSYNRHVSIGTAVRGDSIADLASRILGNHGASVVLPSTCGAGDGGAAGLRVRGFVMDARTPHAPVTSTAALRAALSMPGQTLALEDFRAMRVGPDDRDVVLVLAREDAAAKAVHWIDGASENDLLITFPLPLREYEEMEATVKWSKP